MKLNEREIPDLHELALCEFEDSRIAKWVLNFLYALHVRVLIVAIRARNFCARRIEKWAI